MRGLPLSYGLSAILGSNTQLQHLSSLSVALAKGDLNYDQDIEGVTRLAGAFPDGDDLSVRCRAHSTNADKYSGVIGLNIGFENGMSVQMEYNKNATGERFVPSGVQRF